MSFKVRSVTLKDAELLFNWANDPITRQNSFNSHTIKWDDHVSWLENKIDDTNSLLFLILLDDEPIGIVRLERGLETVIGITVSPFQRGKGYGSEILKSACEVFWRNKTDIIFAYIKKENVSSQRVFKKAGFVFSKSEFYLGFECEKWINKK